MEEKRKVPPFLRQILDIDIYLTDQLVRILEKSLFIRQLSIHHSLLEISAHGILWFAGWLAFIWIFNNEYFYQMQVNFYIGLLTDILLIAILKAIIRRRRPAKNSDPFELGPDKFSFPSGHASRSTFITFFFLRLWPVPSIFILPLIAWTTSVCFSRLLMRRHYILDTLTGIILGILNGLFISLIYFEENTCRNFIHWLTDEKLDGGEYHV